MYSINYSKLLLVFTLFALFGRIEKQADSTKTTYTSKEEEIQKINESTPQFLERIKELPNNNITPSILEDIIKKSEYYEKQGQNDSVLFFDALLLRVAERAKKLEYIAKGQAYLGYDHREAYRLDSAYFYYNNAQKIYKLLGDSLQVGRKLLEMSKIQQKQAAYFESKESVTEALKYLDSIENAHYWGVSLSILAHNFKKLGNFSLAEEFYQKAIAADKKKTSQILYLNNLGLLYHEMGNPEKAIKLFKKALQELPDGLNITEKARLEHNLAVNEWKLNQKNPLPVFLNTLNTRKEHRDDWGLLSSYYSLFEYFYQKTLK